MLVHRLHPYKGKFIPQLVEYFLDNHVDGFKKESCFEPGDIVLDPFSGSGTTMVQASELGLHAIGVDVSEFNAMIGNCKVACYKPVDVLAQTKRITESLKFFLTSSRTIEFENHLLQALYEFNNKYFPVPEFKYRVRQGEIDGDSYGEEKAREFLPIYERLIREYGIKLRQEKADTFLDTWYTQHICDEIHLVHDEIKKIPCETTRRIAALILSRTIRSCRATTHSDLAPLVEPVTTTYYCAKHGKVCKPLFSILKWWETYTKDTVKRIDEFSRLRTETFQHCLTGDSRTIDLFGDLGRVKPEFETLARRQKIRGIFSSPPYAGLIDYHEQHAYAYELFGLTRRDHQEICPLSQGQGREAKENYITGIVDVLKNCRRFLVDDFHVFLVANDKYDLYPLIAERAGMAIVNQYLRPVLNRTERDKRAYSESIFHLRGR